MKKFLALLCMITCIFGLTACGSENALTEYEQYKVNNAQQLADEMVRYLFSQYMDDEIAASFDEYTAEEVAYLMGDQYNINVDGNAFLKAVESFHSAKDSMGAVTGTDGSTVKIDGSQIIVEVNVLGEKKNAVAEMIFSNDIFVELESASLNPSSTVGELMANAGLNTLIGMGTVFVVLILISAIISCFRFIAKAQDNAAQKKKAPVAEASDAENAAARIAEQEAAADETDDLELAAVIAAAVAAYEGASSPDGYVVRSVRKRTA